MVDLTDTDPSREDKRRRKVFNERLKLVVSYLHALALAVLGFGVCATPSTQPGARGARGLSVALPQAED